MFLAKVIGNVVSTEKHSFYEGEKLLLIKPVDPDFKEIGEASICIDRQRAGVGDIIFVVDEGNSARQITNSTMTPLRSANLGIVDSVDIG